MNWIKSTFLYIAPIWTGQDGKMSLRAILAITLTIDFISNIQFAVRKWTENRSFEGLAMVLGIEASLIAVLLGLSTLQNIKTGITSTLETSDRPPTIKKTTVASGSEAVKEIKEADAANSIEPLK